MNRFIKQWNALFDEFQMNIEVENIAENAGFVCYDCFLQSGHGKKNNHNILYLSALSLKSG